jgi:hypothetical protein
MSYLLAVAKQSPLAVKSEIDIEEPRDEKIISSFPPNPPQASGISRKSSKRTI